MEELPLPSGFQSESGGHGTPSLIDIVACPNHQRCADASTFELGSMKDSTELFFTAPIMYSQYLLVGRHPRPIS